MPKLKTHKGASKRFKKTGTGKITRHHSGARHILTSKATSWSLRDQPDDVWRTAPRVLAIGHADTP